MLNGDVDDPDTLSKYNIQLAAHSYNVGKEVTKKDRAYSALWEQERSKYKTNKECDIALKAKKEFQELEDAKNTWRMTKEILTAIRKRQQFLSDVSRNQY